MASRVVVRFHVETTGIARVLDDLVADDSPGMNRLVDPLERDVAGEVIAWRELQLLRLGVSSGRAYKLAALPSHELDIHRFEELVRSGCSAELAERILT